MINGIKKGEDCVGVTVVYYCHDGKGKVLMAKRSQNARDEQGCWDVGGGGLEFGDTVDNTLRKEIREEYSTEVLDFEFLGFRDVHREHNGKQTHWIALDFKVLVNPSLVAIGEPHKFDAIDWFVPPHFPEKVHSQFPAFYEKYKSKL